MFRCGRAGSCALLFLAGPVAALQWYGHRRGTPSTRRFGSTADPSTAIQPKGPGFIDALVGIALDGSPWQYMLSLRAKGYDGCVRVPLGPAGDFYFLLSPDAVKHVCVEAADEWPRRFSVPLFETLALDRGIVYEQGSRHKRQKRLCTPAFERGAAMASFLQAISLESDALVARWRCLNKLDLYAETRTLTLRVVLRVTFGLEPDEADAELSDTIASYLEAIVATANEVPPLYQLYPPLSKNYVRVTEELLPRLRRLVKELIEARRRDAAADAPDLLSQLLRDGTLDDDDILYILFDLVIAGSDTTASTLAASLYILHEPRHARLLTRAVDEARRADLDGLRLEEVRDALPYHVAVARETLRLYPPVPFVGRTALSACDVLGTPAPEGAVACFSPYALGRDPGRWGVDADEFRPDRWLDSERGGASSSFSFLPFGAGPRGCLGTRLGLTEAVVGVAKILRAFSLRFDRSGPLRYKYDLTLNLGDSTTCSVRERGA